MNKHQIRSEQTRKLLIDKLAEIISNGDIDKFSIRGLCGELGFSPRTFYLYFESKEHAINQCYSFQEEKFLEDVKNFNQNINNPWDRLINIFRMGFKNTEKETITVQRRLISILKVYDDYIHSTDLTFYTMVKEEIDACIKHGINFSLPSDRLAWELIMFYRGIIYNHFSAHQKFPLLDTGAQNLERYAKTFIA